MRRVFSFSRYLVLIAVAGLLACAAAVFIFGAFATATIIVEAFGHGEFNAEGARFFSTELIELIDLFLLGTVLFITSIGLYQLFVDPDVLLPGWLSVTSLDQLKLNLLAVIIVMLAVLFLGEAGAEWREGQTILEYGAAIALVTAAAALAVFIFGKVHRSVHGAHESASHGDHAPASPDVSERHRAG